MYRARNLLIRIPHNRQTASAHPSQHQFLHVFCEDLTIVSFSPFRTTKTWRGPSVAISLFCEPSKDLESWCPVEGAIGFSLLDDPDFDGDLLALALRRFRPDLAGRAFLPVSLKVNQPERGPTTVEPPVYEPFLATITSINWRNTKFE